jgi:hypothetical protein
MRRDLVLYEALYPILLSLTQLQELVDDTYIAMVVKRMQQRWQFTAMPRLAVTSLV